MRKLIMGVLFVGLVAGGTARAEEKLTSFELQQREDELLYLHEQAVEEEEMLAGLLPDVSEDEVLGLDATVDRPPGGRRPGGGVRPGHRPGGYRPGHRPGGYRPGHRPGGYRPGYRPGGYRPGNRPGGGYRHGYRPARYHASHRNYYAYPGHRRAWNHYRWHFNPLRYAWYHYGYLRFPGNSYPGYEYGYTYAGSWTCYGYDSVAEDHEGGHVAQSSVYNDAFDSALASCQEYHQNCVVSCTRGN